MKNNNEYLERESLKKIQSEKLVKLVDRMYKNVKVFKDRCDSLNIKIEDIKSIDDLSKLPFSSKIDLRDNYPYGLFACPMDKVVRIHASSGTTGKQIVVGYTKKDIDIWNECLIRAFKAAKISKKDYLQNAFGYGLFTGGLGIHEAATALGAKVIPSSTGNTERQLTTMMDFGTTAITATPSYLEYLTEEIEAKNIKDKIKLKTAICGAEPWGETLRKSIESRLNIKAYDIYGLSEIMGPGVAYECECQCGMHFNEDHFIPEILVPDTNIPVKDGEVGELVITTLDKEAFPLIRFRTHDLASIYKEKCSCGRTFKRITKIKGRTDDMLIIRGVNVFPSQIEEILLKTSNGVTPNYQIIVDRVNSTDTLEIKVELTEELFSDDVKTIETITQNIKDAIRSTLGLGAKITLVAPKTIDRSEGKAKRVIDKRIIL